MTKRLFDVFVSFIALCLLSPVMVVLAIAIRLSSKGPVLFRQRRVGQFGRVFEILKFRTMRAAPIEGAPEITVGADPRITRIGHLLRQAKLDELPQLINVLRGEMSMVGPRPEVEQYVALYPAADRAIVQTVRPGITDRSSIVFRSEAELLARQSDPETYYREIILPQKVAMSVAYARSQSIGGDLRILLDTFFAIAFPKANQASPEK